MTVSSLGRGFNTPADAAMLASYALQGQQIAMSDPRVMVARNASADSEYQRGFDVGTAVGRGHTLPGPGQDAIRSKLAPMYGGSANALRGFDVGQTIQFGVTKNPNTSANPSVAAGQLVVNGVAGSGLNSNVKAGAVQAVTANNPAAAQGAAAAVAAKTGLWARFVAFFGL